MFKTLARVEDLVLCLSNFSVTFLNDPIKFTESKVAESVAVKLLLSGERSVTDDPVFGRDFLDWEPVGVSKSDLDLELDGVLVRIDLVEVS